MYLIRDLHLLLYDYFPDLVTLLRYSQICKWLHDYLQKEPPWTENHNVLIDARRYRLDARRFLLAFYIENRRTLLIIYKNYAHLSNIKGFPPSQFWEKHFSCPLTFCSCSRASTLGCNYRNLRAGLELLFYPSGYIKELRHRSYDKLHGIQIRYRDVKVCDKDILTPLQHRTKYLLEYCEWYGGDRHGLQVVYTKRRKQHIRALWNHGCRTILLRYYRRYKNGTYRIICGKASEVLERTMLDTVAVDNIYIPLL